MFSQHAIDVQVVTKFSNTMVIFCASQNHILRRRFFSTDLYEFGQCEF